VTMGLHGVVGGSSVGVKEVGGTGNEGEVRLWFG